MTGGRLEDPKTPGFRPAALMLALAAVTVLAYLPALANGFVNWDDALYVTDNPAIRHLDLNFLMRVLTEPMALNYHPLTMVSHALDHAVWGMNPFGHHLTSVFFHGLNTSLVFLLLIRLFPSAGGAWRESREVWAAALAALLFGLHPLHVESVAWVSERKDVLYAAFYILSILAYLRYVRQEPGRARGYAIALVWFFLALLSKPMAVTLPMVLLILDVFPLGRLEWGRGAWKPEYRRVWIEKIPFIAVAIAFSLITLAIQEKAKGDAPLYFRTTQALFAWVFYLAKTVWPADLAPLYPDTMVVGLLRSPGILMAYLAAFSAITYLAYRYRRRRPGLPAAWCLYTAQLLPVLGLVQVGSQAAADRYTYLPTVPVLFLLSRLVAEAAARWPGARRAAVALASVVLLVTLAVATRAQIAVWKDPVTLWDHEIRLFPDQSAEAYYNRGCGYLALTADEEALQDFNKAIEIDPTHDMSYVNRAFVSIRLGRTAQALDDLNKAIELDPENEDAFFNRGTLFMNRGDLWSALADYTRVIEIDNGHVKALRNRGRVFSALGAYPEALRDFSRAIEIEPGDAQAHADLGSVLGRLGRAGEAEAQAREAERLGWKKNEAGP